MGGKAGGGASSYDYFGNFGAAICHGPVDVLYAVIADGKAVWEDTDGVERGVDNYLDLTSGVDPKYFGVLTNGYLRFYWGTSSQVATGTGGLTLTLAYKNVAYIAARAFLFGTAKTNAPNLEVICARKPVCSTALCATLDNVLDDGQANPVAALAELATSRHGLGLPLARLDASSWADAAAYAATLPDQTFCSPLLTSYADARSSIASLLAMFDGALAWTASGTLAIRLLKPGVNPGGLATLDAPLLTEKPSLKTGGWGGVPTGFVVRYADRDRHYKEADEKLDNLLALHLRGEDNRSSMDLPHVTRRDQAMAIAAELIRRTQHPVASLHLSVRRERADTFTPGQKVLADVDPEPASAGLAQLATITERRDDGQGTVKLELTCDPIATAAPYSPTFTPETPQAADVASIGHALIVPLPDQPPYIGILAARPQDDCIGFDCAFSDATDFALLGRQAGFAARMTLDTAVDADDTTLRWTLTDGETGRDAYLAALTAGDSITAQTDYLLGIMANVTAGVIDVDGDGLPELEFVSIVSRTAVDADTHDYTVLRARKSLAARPWTTGAQVWIIPGVNLAAWTHPLMDTLQLSGATGTVRLTAVTAYAADDADPLPEFDFVFPGAYNVSPVITWTTPATSPDDIATSGEITPDATITDTDGNLVRVQLYSIAAATGVQTSHLDASFPASNSVTLDALRAQQGLTWPVDLGTQEADDLAFDLVLVATDDEGRSSTSTMRLILPGSSSLGLGAITFTEDGYSPSPRPLTMEATGINATQIHWAGRVIGSVAPSTYVVGGTTVNHTVSSSLRIWARASDGVNHSPWQYVDVVFETS